MTTFLFVRHAMTTGGAGDPGLSIPGRELARAVAEPTFATADATYVFSSPLRRACADRARRSRSSSGSKLLVDERLRETHELG